MVNRHIKQTVTAFAFQHGASASASVEALTWQEWAPTFASNPRQMSQGVVVAESDPLSLTVPTSRPVTLDPTPRNAALAVY